MKKVVHATAGNDAQPYFLENKYFQAPIYNASLATSLLHTPWFILSAAQNYSTSKNSSSFAIEKFNI